MAALTRRPRLAPAAGIALLVAFPFAAFYLAGPAGSLKWIDNYGIQILLYVTLGWGLNIVVGLAGLLDLGYVAFYAVGAYSYALLAATCGWSFWACLPAAGVIAALWGIMLGFPVLRLRGDYLAIVTLAFGEIVRIVLVNWTALTNGDAGIGSIPRITFFGWPFVPGPNGFAAHLGLKFASIHRVIFLYFLILALALLTNFLTLRLRRLPMGRAWEALREDEIACRSLGLNTVTTKLTAFALGALVAGVCGAIFAARQNFVSPSSFTFVEVGDDPRDRGAWRRGVSTRRRARRRRHCWRHGTFAGIGRSQAHFWRCFRSSPISHAHRWHGHGRRDELETARPYRHPQTIRFTNRGKARHANRGRSRLMTLDPTLLLSVEHLSLRFGGITAVDDLTFSAKRGDITALIGPNGAGKTTVFNCVTGFYKPDTGRLAFMRKGGASLDEIQALTLSGKRQAKTGQGELFLLERMADFEIARHAGIARTFQNIRLFAGMTVLENLIVARHNFLMAGSAFGLKGLLGLPSSRARERQAIETARYWLDKTGLLSRAGDLSGTLPHGAQRRLEIARAMCTAPTLLCLDEPAAGLNPRETAGLNELLLAIAGEHDTSILLIEHDMWVVMGICDHIAVLDHGVKIAEGPPRAIRDDENVIKAYLGTNDDVAFLASAPGTAS